MDTERLYYADCYLSEFEAAVVGIGPDGRGIFLDKTAFYPTSGGQPNDLGSISGVAVLDVIDEGNRILHVLERPINLPTVKGRVDWPRRYDHMQQHTGQHLLSAVFQETLDAATLSFHMGSEVSTIDLALKELSESQAAAVEDRVNEAARIGPAVTISFEDAAAAEGLRKQSDRAGTLRVVTIDRWDRSACGGTHVRNASEVLPVQLRKAEKMRGNVRVEFVCGDRATRLARRDYRALAQLARLAGTSTDKALEYFTTLRQRLEDAEKDRQRLTNKWQEREGMDLYAATVESADGVRRCFQQLERIDEAQRAKARAYTSQPKALLLLCSPDGVLVACSPDSGFNAAALLKAAIAVCGGTGGGSPVLAQGKLAGADWQRVLTAAANFD